MPVTTGALSYMNVSARTAPEDIGTEGAVSALLDGGDCLAMIFRHGITVEVEIFRGIEFKDVLYSAHN